MAIPNWVELYLNKNHISHEYHHHKPVFSAQELSDMEHVSPFAVAKVVVAMCDERPMLLVLPAPYRLDIKAMKEELGVKRFRLATEDEITRTFNDCETGAIPPLTHWQGVPIYLKKDGFKKTEKILFQAGSHEETAVVNLAEWRNAVKPQELQFGELTQEENSYVHLKKYGKVLGIASAVLLVILAFITFYYLFAYSMLGSISGNLAASSVAWLGSGILLVGLGFLGAACAVGFMASVLYMLGWAVYLSLNLSNRV